jgi:hypothetical protein
MCYLYVGEVWEMALILPSCEKEFHQELLFSNLIRFQYLPCADPEFLGYLYCVLLLQIPT